MSSQPLFTQILAAVDGEQPAHWAIHSAIVLAEPGAKISVMHVIPPLPPFEAPYLPPEEPQAVAATNDPAIVAAMGLIPADLRGQQIYREGNIHAELLDAIHRLHADVIVIGAHGRGAIEHLLLGSTTLYMLRHAPCPVLVTSHSHRSESLKRILFMGVAQTIAMELARRHNAVVRRIRIESEPQQAADSIESIIVSGDTAEGIVKAAAEWDADLIVMPCHHRHGLEHLKWTHDPCEYVAQHAPCPVLCVSTPAM